MIRRPPRSTLDRSSAASDVYKRQIYRWKGAVERDDELLCLCLSLIHISEPTRQAEISYAVFCLKKKKKKTKKHRPRPKDTDSRGATPPPSTAIMPRTAT